MSPTLNQAEIPSGEHRSTRKQSERSTSSWAVSALGILSCRSAVHGRSNKPQPERMEREFGNGFQAGFPHDSSSDVFHGEDGKIKSGSDFLGKAAPGNFP